MSRKVWIFFASQIAGGPGGIRFTDGSIKIFLVTRTQHLRDRVMKIRKSLGIKSVSTNRIPRRCRFESEAIVVALILEGKTTCPICGKVLKTGEEIMGFPAFVSNQADPLLLFNDAGFHKDCVLAHALWPTLNWRMREYDEKTGPGHRKGLVCGEEITHPDEYFGLGHLTDNPAHALFQFNYAHFTARI
jgi:hypothetical protein